MHNIGVFKFYIKRLLNLRLIFIITILILSRPMIVNAQIIVNYNVYSTLDSKDSLKLSSLVKEVCNLLDSNLLHVVFKDPCICRTLSYETSYSHHRNIRHDLIRIIPLAYFKKLDSLFVEPISLEKCNKLYANTLDCKYPFSDYIKERWRAISLNDSSRNLFTLLDSLIGFNKNLKLNHLYFKTMYSSKKEPYSNVILIFTDSGWVNMYYHSNDRNKIESHEKIYRYIIRGDKLLLESVTLIYSHVYRHYKMYSIENRSITKIREIKDGKEILFNSEKYRLLTK